MEEKKKMTEKEKTEKDTTTAEELDITSSSKSFDVLDWLWGPTVKRTVLGLLRSKRERTKAHGK